MPFQLEKPDKFDPENPVEVKWDNFGGGWNTFSKETELDADELSQADNMMLIGSGSPTGRWGSETFFLPADTGQIRMLNAFYNSETSTNHLLAITDEGFLVRKNGASYTRIQGASFFSGSRYQSAQMGDPNDPVDERKGGMFIASATLPLVRYDGSSLIPYKALGQPTNIQASMLSSVSGTNVYHWRITAVSKTGETNVYEEPVADLAAATLMPLDLSNTLMLITWDAISAAPGDIQGYNVYRGFPGEEGYLATVGSDSTSFEDDGAATSNIKLAPTGDTTEGLRAKYIMKFDDRFVMAGVPGDPSAVYISGRFPYQDRFSFAYGGGKANVSPDDGEDIVGLGIAGNQAIGTNPPPVSSIIVFKERSVHRITLGTISVGNFTILDPIVQMLTDANGCSAPESIVSVNNDVFYFGRQGLFSIGQESEFLNQIRTNEISARIRPYIDSLDKEDFENAAGAFIDDKYILSFPDRKETIIFDTERNAFMGPWKTPWGITGWFEYFDEGGTQRWLAESTSTPPYVREFSPSLLSDSGTAISKVMRTKKSEIGDWSIMKIIQLFYVLLQNVRGQVSIDLRIEGRSGNTIVEKSFTITSTLGQAGWGIDQYGTIEYGNTKETVLLTGDEIVRFANIYKQARVMQVEVRSNGANANFELLGTKIVAQPLGPQSLPGRLRV